MTLIFFKFALPVVLGYTIFVGIAGQYAPFRRPMVAKKRPVWFLGLWVGITIAIIAAAGLQLAHQLELHELKALAKPSTVTIVAALLPGIIGFYWYRWQVKSRNSENVELQTSPITDHEEPNRFDNSVASNTQASHNLGKNVPHDSTARPDNAGIVSADKQKIKPTLRADTLASSDIGLDETFRFDVDPAEYNEPRLVNAETGIDSDTKAKAKTETDLGTVDVDKVDVDKVDESDCELSDRERNAKSFFNDVESERSCRLRPDSEKFTPEATELAASQHEITSLRNELDKEVHMRKELEMHLRITRKGLGVLESETRDFESNKATALINIERELEEKIKLTSAAEARADREIGKRVDLENEMLKARKDTLKATSDCRISAEARASALSTANKATTLARQAMQIRLRLESQLGDSKKELDRKQATISSLIKALEKEKSRTQEDVSLMAKQLRLHEKQLLARRTLEEVTRTIDNKLTTRLVKKVAKSRN